MGADFSSILTKPQLVELEERTTTFKMYLKENSTAVIPHFIAQKSVPLAGKFHLSQRFSGLK